MEEFYIDEIEFTHFLKEVYHTYGEDFVHYNHNTLTRRVQSHCVRLKINLFEEYKELILSDKEKFDEMFSFFSINVTEFFRESKELNKFRKKVVPYLNSYAHIKIWCAGCSSGESPYSLAMLLDEEGVLDKVQIYATDFNNRVLAKAKSGLFEIKNIEQSRENYIKSGGKYTFDNYFIKQGKYHKVKRYLQERILFFNHNLATDGVMNEFQLIICKNVLIYFDEELKMKVIKLFDDSLEENGFLIIGKNEYLPDGFENRFQHYLLGSKIYHKSFE